MPIMKLSDKKTLDRVYRFPHCGELLKGDSKPSRGAGKERPFWRFGGRCMPGAKAAFEAAYKTEVKELPDAALAYDTPEQNFDSWVECREPGVGGKFWWRSDGERSVIRWVPESEEYTDDPDRQLPHAELPNRKWERNQGRLFVRLQGLARQGFSQPVLIRTGGINDIVRIAQFLHGLKEEVEQVYGPGTTLKHYLVMLWRFEVSRADPTSGSRYPHWDIGIARSPLYMQSALKDSRQRAIQLAAGGAVKLLDTTTGEFIDAETDYPTDAEVEAREDWVDPTFIPPEPTPESKSEPEPEPKPEKPKRKPRKPKAEKAPADTPPPAKQTLLDDEGTVDFEYDPSAKAASLSGCDMNKWRAAANKLAEANPTAFAPSGKPDFSRILAIAGRLGYEKISTKILPEIVECLSAFAEQATDDQLVPF